METCFLSSNGFTKTLLEFLPSTPTISTYSRTSISRKLGRPFSLTCCQLGSSSPSPQDDWRSFRSRLVVGEQQLRLGPEPNPETNPDIVIDPPPTITLGDKWIHPIHEPEKGCLLIATEKLDGVHIFEKKVILLLSIGPVGPTGIILNKPSLMSIKEQRSSSGPFSDKSLFFGGPLEDRLFLVSPEKGNDSIEKNGVFDEVMKGLYYGSKESIGCAAEMVKRNVIGVDEFRFFDGYCAWAKGQLRDEIKEGYWTVAACSPSVIGLDSIGSVGLWDEVIGLMGPTKVW